jgi:hypothetical protein
LRDQKWNFWDFFGDFGFLGVFLGVFVVFLGVLRGFLRVLEFFFLEGWSWEGWGNLEIFNDLYDWRILN